MKRRTFRVLLACVMAFSLMLPSTVFGAEHPYSKRNIEMVMAKIYEPTVVELKGLKVLDEAGAPFTEALEFKLFNTTTQEFLPNVKSSNGVLEDTKLIKGHHYILSLENAKYEMKDDSKITNKYFSLRATGESPRDDKTVNQKYVDNYGDKYDANKASPKAFDSITVAKRAKELTADELKKVNRIPLGLTENNPSGGLSLTELSGSIKFPDMGDQIRPSDYADLKVKLVNQYETIELTPDEFEFFTGDLIEDVNYAVVMETKDPDLSNYVLLTPLLTTKNHQEQGFAVPTRTYTHFTCNSIGGFNIADSSWEEGQAIIDEVTSDPIKSFQGSSTLDGIRAFIDQGRKINTDPKGALLLVNRNEFVFSERVLEKTDDKVVVDFDTINMHRDEISKLPYGDYTITTSLHEGKKVAAVYNVDANGNKVEDLKFTQDENDLSSLKINTPNISLYNTVIEFEHKHTLEAVAGTPSTCTKHGVKDHFKCTACNELFLDADGKTKITAEDTVLPLAAHEYKDGKCTVCGASENPGGSGGTGGDTGSGGSDSKPGDSQEVVKPADPDTGDHSNFALWAFVALASVAGVGSVAFAKRKNN